MPKQKPKTKPRGRNKGLTAKTQKPAYRRQFAKRTRVLLKRASAPRGFGAGIPDLLETDTIDGVTPGRIEGGDFAVTPDGAATYTLPLWVPPGRLSIQPELALRYHSRGGNGTLGVGWSLSGISQITRGKKTMADDGALGPVRCDRTDPFYLDGERLVIVSGVHGTDGAEYRTKRDTFAKIILHDIDSSILGPT